jgi:hypothetical protein
MAVYEGDSVCCDVELKFRIITDNLYTMFQNSIILYF